MDIPIENYKLLGCAIIQQAYFDYMQDNLAEVSLIRFLQKTPWVQCLDLDIDYFIEHAIAEKRKKDGCTDTGRQSHYYKKVHP